MSDVTVCGAGPSGLSAAIAAARAGRAVTVFERGPEPGHRFHDDFQGLENFSVEEDTLDELRRLGVETRFDAVPYREIMLFDPAGTPHLCRSSEPLFYVVRRGPRPGTLDRALFEQASSLGVRFRFNEFRDPGRDAVLATGGSGADMVAAGYLFDTDAEDGAYAAVAQQLAPRGYAYLLVHGGRATLATFLFGTCGDARRHADASCEFFRDALRLTIRNKKPYGGRGSILPRSSTGELRPGEAGGFQDALWGFGLRHALLSGHFAGDAAAHGQPRSFYHHCNRRLHRLLDASALNRHFFDRLGDVGFATYARFLAGASDSRVWLRQQHTLTLWKSLVLRWTRRYAPG